jgi:hypothetical protein
VLVYVMYNINKYFLIYSLSNILLKRHNHKTKSGLTFLRRHYVSDGVPVFTEEAYDIVPDS